MKRFLNKLEQVTGLDIDGDGKVCMCVRVFSSESMKVFMAHLDSGC